MSVKDYYYNLRPNNALKYENHHYREMSSRGVPEKIKGKKSRKIKKIKGSVYLKCLLYICINLYMPGFIAYA